MQKAGQYVDQVVDQIEADFCGYMLENAAGAGASSVPATVKPSGLAEAASLPDHHPAARFASVERDFSGVQSR